MKRDLKNELNTIQRQRNEKILENMSWIQKKKHQNK